MTTDFCVYLESARTLGVLISFGGKNGLVRRQHTLTLEYCVLIVFFFPSGTIRPDDYTLKSARFRLRGMYPDYSLTPLVSRGDTYRLTVWYTALHVSRPYSRPFCFGRLEVGRGNQSRGSLRKVVLVAFSQNPWRPAALDQYDQRPARSFWHACKSCILHLRLNPKARVLVYTYHTRRVFRSDYVVVCVSVRPAGCLVGLLSVRLFVRLYFPYLPEHLPCAPYTAVSNMQDKHTSHEVIFRADLFQNKGGTHHFDCSVCASFSPFRENHIGNPPEGFRASLAIRCFFRHVRLRAQGVQNTRGKTS